MTKIPLDIDRVVREVLAELKRAPATDVSPSPSETSTTFASAEPAEKGPFPATVENGELVLSTRLLTLTEIGSRLAGIQRVVVSPQTVVTPAARDALRQRNITLCHASAQIQCSGGALRLIVVAVRTKIDPKLVANALRSEGINVLCQSTDCLLAATDQLAGELAKGNTLGVLLTPHTAAAVCLANRLTGVRAVLASDTNSIKADTSAVGANLLIVDPQRVGFFKLSGMVGEFCRSGVRPCPEVFRKRLI